MKIINPKLREEVALKLVKIARRPQAYDARKRLVIEDLRSIGDVYSFWIENPDLRKQLLYANGGESAVKLRKKARQGIQAVHNGWYFLHQKAPHGGFIQILSPGVLCKVDELVGRGIEGTGKFRTKDVTLDYVCYTPPSWQKVPELVDKTIIEVKRAYKEDPLHAAILAHLSITGVQPFMEANKRTVRLIQDKILYDAEMPPAIIPAGEGTFYFDLLGRTLPAWRDGNLDGQRQFYDYCTSKVNNGLDEILGDLEEEPAITNR